MPTFSLSWPWLLAGTVGVSVLILIYLAIVVWRSRTDAAAVDDDEAGAEDAPTGDAPTSAAETAPPSAAEPGGRGEDGGATLAPLIQRSFRRGIRRLRGYVSGWQHRYKVPWFLLAGAAGSRDLDLLAGAGLGLPFGEPPMTESGCTWWFFDRGVVLDVDGDLLLRADGSSSDERGWRTLLRLLQKHRPQRPIDGMVLTVSCAELQAAAAGGSEAMADLERRASRLYTSLWQTQRQLGVRFPVYVLVTGCERVQGFCALAEALPAPLRDGILGWSSPYSVDTAYRAGWVDEAVKTLGRRLDRVQLELLSEAPEGADVDEIFLFPGALRQLAEPLRLWLDNLFKPSAYHESMLLRGLYFCGRREEPEAPGSGADPYRPAGRHTAHRLFLKELLETKVFAESGLAAPTAATLISRNRTVRAAAAALAATVALLVFGTWWAHARLRHGNETLRPFLQKTDRYLGEVLELRRGGDGMAGPGIGDALVKDAAEHLLVGLTRIDTRRYDSVFLPASWFSPFNHELRGAMVRAYDEIILKAMHHYLTRRAEDLASERRLWEARRTELAESLEDAEDSALVSIEAMPSYQQLAGYLAELTELEGHGEVYNGLRDSRDLHGLAELIDYIFETPLPDGFVEGTGPYRRALHAVDYPQFTPQRVREGTTGNARRLAERFYQRLFREGRLAEYLETLRRDLDRILFEGGEGADRFEATIRRMDGIERALSQSGLEWAFRQTFDLGPGYERLLVRIERSAFLGPDLRQEVQNRGQAMWAEFRESLQRYRSRLTGGSFLELDDDGARMELSDDTVLLKAALETFRDQRFLSLPEDPRRFRAELPPGQRLLWDRDLLDRAAGLSELYGRFQVNSEELHYFPVELRPSLESVARRRLGMKMSDLIARAQSFEPAAPASSPLLREQELRAEITSFQVAARPLQQLVDQFEELHLDREARELAALGAHQGIQLLAAVDGLLTAEGFYQPLGGGFSWWTGEGPVSVSAFGARDPEELAVYLGIQRQRLTQLADEYAKPLVTWLGSVGSQQLRDDRGLVLKWESILEGLYGYANQKPGNPLAELERFVLEELPAVELDGCFDAIPPGALARESGDYFLARRNRMRRRLLDRCAVLAGRRAEDGYREIESFFNQRLAGKYPFSDQPPGAFSAEADPEDLRAFFELYDRHAGIIRSLPEESPGLGRARQPVLGFVDRMGRVRGFFSAFLDAEEKEPAPLFDVDAEFRVNQSYERGANRILGWSLGVGERELGYRDDERRARWTLGRPLRLTLRWANGSPSVPTVREAEPGVALRIVDRSVIYEYANRWSLLSMLQAHRSQARDFDQLTDPEPHTLKFVIDTRPVEGGGFDPTPTRVFVRLTVKPPGSPQPVELPRFPHQAPRLGPAGDAVAAHR